ncbi:hypothetical protein IT568_01180 [bacterium]|nr:hypothetical protein [bacterium]
MFFAILSLIFALNLNVFAGAWTQKKGKYYQKFSLNFFSTKREFHSNGKEQNYASGFGISKGEFSDFSFAYYLEYGLIEKLTFVSNFSAKNIGSKGVNTSSNESFNHTTNGFSDLILGLRYNFFSLKQTVFAIQNDAFLPLFYDKKDNPPIGNSKFSNLLKIQSGTSLYPLPVYFTDDFGYKFKNAKDSEDEFVYSFELGFVFRETILKNSLDGVLSTEKIKQTNTETNSAKNGNFLRWTIGVIHKLPQNLQLNFDFAKTLQGKNTLSYNSFALGIAFTN